jgi:hypothetical protein
MSYALQDSEVYSANPYWTSNGNSEAAREVQKIITELNLRQFNTGGSQIVEHAIYRRLADIRENLVGNNNTTDEEQSVSEIALDDAKTFLRSLPQRFNKPDVLTEPNGNVAFEWHFAPYRTMVVSFFGNGRLAFSSLRSPTKSSFGYERFLRGQIPQKLISELVAIEA